MINLPTAAQLQTPATPSAQGLASSIVSNNQKVMGIANQAASEVNKVIQERNDEQQNAAFSKVNNVMHDFDAANAGKEYYTGDEIPDDLDFKKTEIQIDADGNEVEVVRERIPAYEIQAAMRDKYHRKAIAAAAADIESPSRRTLFMQQMEERANSQNIRYLERSAAEQTESIRRQQNEDFTQSLLNRDYETAAYIAHNFNGSDTERQEKARNVRYMMEADSYADAMSEDDVGRMQSALKFLSKDGYAGELNEPQRLATIDQLKARINLVNKRNEASYQGRLTLLGVEVDRTIDALESGEMVSPQHQARLFAQIQAAKDAGLISSEDSSWVKRTAFFSEAATYSPDLVQFKSKPLQEQEAVIREMRNSAVSGSDYHKLDIYTKNHENAKSMLNSDPLMYGAQTGIIDLQPFDFADPAASLVKRQNDVASMKSQYGDSMVPAFFTKQEAMEFSRVVQDAPVKDQMRMLSIINGQLSKDNANAVRSQLMGNGGGVLAVASDALDSNQPYVAEKILMGRNALKEVPEAFKSWDTDASPLVLSEIGNAYSASPATMGQVMESIKAAYAAQTVNEGDFSGTINSKRLKSVIKEVTGGLIKIGSSTIVSPDRNMDENKFDSWLRDVQPKYLDTLGGVKGYNGRAGVMALHTQVSNGDVTMVNVGKDKYLLRGENGFLVKRDDPSSVFILQYNPDAVYGSKW
ncbi:hypothetical protein VP5_gp16 [Vibrio phage VP5]|uniref:hypothetical protein n=1 Tax=Vibrio phage VP5 TaxID=260827 RepID=UPI00003CEC4D|nr:hypothetical protein VP5_gp16 [Vibrio phage VP5]